jgi:hypothetical protein
MCDVGRKNQMLIICSLDLQAISFGYTKMEGNEFAK